MELQMNFKRAEDAIIFPWLQQNLTPQRTIVDIGARKGHWFKKIAYYFPDSPSHLFEPTPNIYEWLDSKHRKNDRVNIHGVALSDESNTLDFHIDLELGGWSGLTKQREDGKYRTIKVPVKTLDSYKLKNVGLIKIDVEGNELKTIRGAEKTIKSSKPFVYFECADVHMTNYDYGSGEIFDFFNNLNYNILDLDLNVCTKEQLQEHTASNSSLYHNFIAKPK
jgi:FkbM family methyltransferase